MIKLKRATANDDSTGQTEARLSRQLRLDKERILVRNRQEIKRAKGMLQRAHDPHLRKRLSQRIETLENENTETQKFL